jgi:hypothetical protein
VSDDVNEVEDEEYIPISMLIHGEEGVGKSWLGQTAPAPRLVLDAEGGSKVPRRRFPDGRIVKQKKIKWDPTKEEPPEAGDWETCHVMVRKYADIDAAYAWLNAGDHPFRSVVIDSLTEVQKRCKDSISGLDTPSERDWGLLLIKVEGLVRAFRDLTSHPDTPLDAVVILALTHEKSGRRRPAVQGALGTSLPGYVDLEGYLYVKENEEDGTSSRKLLITPKDGFAAKDRTHVLSEHYGSVVSNPDVEEMLEVMNDEDD